MIRVVTSGYPGGLVQTFLPENAGPPKAIAGAWVRVRRGRVGIGTGNGGNTGVNTVSTKINEWEHLDAPNGIAPANEFIIYAVSPGGADFDVAVVGDILSNGCRRLSSTIRFEPADDTSFRCKAETCPPLPWRIQTWS